MALDQEILVASELAPGLPRLCVLSSAGAVMVEVAVATSDTRSPRQVQINLQTFFFCVCGSHVEVLSVIQVYRFCEMCYE